MSKAKLVKETEITTKPATSLASTAATSNGLPIIGVARQLEAKPNPTSHIFSLPVRLLEAIFCNSHIKDLLNLLATHPKLHNLLKNSTMVWSCVTFTTAWPSMANLSFFKKASRSKNFEATVKLGIAYLYNEGFSHNSTAYQVQSNGTAAAEMLVYADRLSDSNEPFSWLLYRPPWSLKNCNKERVCTYLCNRMRDNASINGDVLTCIARIALLNDDNNLATHCLRDARNLHLSSNAAYLLWQLTCKSNRGQSLANNIESVRQLRSAIRIGDNLEASLALLTAYMSGCYGGLDAHIAADYTRNTFQKSQPVNLCKVYATHAAVTESMRYILVDWLIEVCTVKGLSSRTLHQSVYMMDRYMTNNRSMQRSQLQLLGVSSLVICSRFMSDNVITIWEACWLTDNTYQYTDVVKMMAEIITSLRGKIRVVTAFDYLQSLFMLNASSEREQHLTQYICEISLQHVELTTYKQTYIAVSCLVLARLMLKSDYVWNEKCVKFTGILLRDLRSCLLHIHEKCFVEDAPTDHRDVKLESVRIRYTSELMHAVSQVPSVSREALLVALGSVKAADRWVQSSCSLRLRSQPYHIKSPSRKHGNHYNSTDPCKDESRNNAGTPPPYFSAYVDTSFQSGYEVDSEYDGDFQMPVISDYDDSLDETLDVDGKSLNDTSIPDNGLTVNLKPPKRAISGQQASTKASVGTSLLTIPDCKCPYNTHLLAKQVKRKISPTSVKQSKQKL